MQARGTLLAPKDFLAQFKAVTGMGRLRFELRTNRLKAECSTAELATRRVGQAPGQPFRAPSERITQPGSPPRGSGPSRGQERSTLAPTARSTPWHDYVSLA